MDKAIARKRLEQPYFAKTGGQSTANKTNCAIVANLYSNVSQTLKDTFPDRKKMLISPVVRIAPD
jgi:hypothetical protein